MYYYNLTFYGIKKLLTTQQKHTFAFYHDNINKHLSYIILRYHFNVQIKEKKMVLCKVLIFCKSPLATKNETT